MPTQKKKGKKVEETIITEIELHTTFKLTYPENAQNVAMALAQAGHFVNIHRDNGSYVIDIYKRV